MDHGGGTATVLRVHADHLGTPQSMTDDLGAVVWERHQRPFGETASQTGTPTNDRRFPGQLFDDESGYHYNYFRDYDPSIGRYLQSDPIGIAGGLNTYGYVGGNPVNFVDPLGLYTLAPVAPMAPAAKGLVAACIANPLVCAIFGSVGVGCYLLYEAVSDDGGSSSDDSESDNSDETQTDNIFDGESPVLETDENGKIKDDIPKDPDLSRWTEEELEKQLEELEMSINQREREDAMADRSDSGHEGRIKKEKKFKQKVEEALKKFKK